MPLKIRVVLANAAIFLLTSVGMLFLADAALFAFQNWKVEQSPAAYPSHLSERGELSNWHYSFSTNAQGLRYGEVRDRRAAGEKRVVVLGDSFVFGEGVETRQTFSALLEKWFSQEGKNLRFINAGVSGAGPVEYRHILKQAALGYNPDAVLLVIFANDLQGTSSPYIFREDEANLPKNPVKKAVYDLFPNLYASARELGLWVAGRVAGGKQIPSVWETEIRDDLYYGYPSGWRSPDLKIWMEKIDRRLQGLSEADLRRQRTQLNLTVGQMDVLSSLQMTSVENQRQWTYFEKNLSEIAGICRKKKISLGVIYMPAPIQVDERYAQFAEKWFFEVDRPTLQQQTLFQKQLAAWSGSMRCPFLDLSQSFQNAPKKAYFFRVDQHLNGLGHRFVAHTLKNWLQAQKDFALP